MKTLQKSLLALTATVAMVSGANAAIIKSGQPYVGVKVGQIDYDISGADKPTAYGVVAGYQFDPNWGVEAQYVAGDGADLSVNGSKVGELDAKTYGLYGTYTYNFGATPIYVKGKVGVAKAEAKYTQGSFKGKVDDTGLAVGLGVGYQATSALALEAEYEKPESDTNIWTIGAKVKF